LTKLYKKAVLLNVIFLLVLSSGNSQSIQEFKVIDNGGAGTHKAIAAKDSIFPDFTIYRPTDLDFAVSKTTLPLIVFGNGGCFNTSLPFERYLNEIASFGYVVMAIGPFQDSINTLNDSIAYKYTYPEKMLEAIDKMTAAVHDTSCEYYLKVDLDHVAVMGQSCGGLQALAVSGDSRVTTTVCLNSAVIDPDTDRKDRIKDPVVGKEVLETLHSPVLYLTGGPSDVAYDNALDDFSRIRHVFVSMANVDVGHAGTYQEKFGGSFAAVTLQWLEWQLKDHQWAGDVFLGEDCICEFPGWTINSRNYIELSY
jgi:hypothetical protein